MKGCKRGFFVCLFVLCCFALLCFVYHGTGILEGIDKVLGGEDQ